MCNLYSVTKGQAAIIAATRAMRDTTGNLPPMPSIFPDYPAPVVRNAADGVSGTIYITVVSNYISGDSPGQCGTAQGW